MEVFLGRLNVNLLPRALVMGVVVFRTCLTSAENNKCVFPSQYTITRLILSAEVEV